MNVENFSQQLVDRAAGKDISTENQRRPYLTAILPDEEVFSKKVQIMSMTGQEVAVMPHVDDGNPPVYDSLKPLSMHEVNLMHYWVQCDNSHHLFLQLSKKLQTLKMGDVGNDKLQKLIDALFVELYVTRTTRLQDLQALQLGNVLTNISDDGLVYSGFNTSGWIHNDSYQYMASGLRYQPMVFPTTENPATWLLQNLVDSTDGVPNEIWVGTEIRDWFLTWSGWSTYNKLQQPQRFMVNVGGAEVPAKGASLLYEIEGIKIICIDYKVKRVTGEQPLATDLSDRYKYGKVPVFNPKAAVCVNTETLGSTLFCKPRLLNNNLYEKIHEDLKLNYYKNFSAEFPEKDALYRSEGFTLAAVKDLSSINVFIKQ